MQPALRPTMSADSELQSSTGQATQPVFTTTVGPVRIITAASLFDGHDAAINVMRRLIQEAGAEVIHLGHDRSAQDVVDAAVQEDAHAIALTSYQGGHIEYFSYIRTLLNDMGCEHVRIFGGGGGMITPPEIMHLQDNGITKIYSPEDGQHMGLMGMIHHLMKHASDVDVLDVARDAGMPKRLMPQDTVAVARLLTLAECADEKGFRTALEGIQPSNEGHSAPIIGVTGTGGAGKSSLLDELMLRIIRDQPETRICLLCIDPTKKRTGGALLGDRIRMNSLSNSNLFMRSIASRGSGMEVSTNLDRAIEVAQHAGFDLIFCETSGIGQGSDAITRVADVSMYVMTAEFGAQTQLEKIEMLDSADLIVLNKAEKIGSEDALKAIRKQVRRNRNEFSGHDNELPVVATIASQFANAGVDSCWMRLAQLIDEYIGTPTWKARTPDAGAAEHIGIIHPNRVHYLAEIAATVRDHHDITKDEVEQLRTRQALYRASEHAESEGEMELASNLELRAKKIENELRDGILDEMKEYRAIAEEYRSGNFTYTVRGRAISVETTTTSLAGSSIPRIGLPHYDEDGGLHTWLRSENLPGHFPFTAGVYPFKRSDESPTRMFAGEGPPERTNQRFHYLSENQDYARLSTAFDSVTLYGRDPDLRPDIYGKVGNSGVSIATLDDAKRLYSGFDLCDPNTSVSMTINGPAPIILAFFLNAAIDQQVEKRLKEDGRWNQRAIDAMRTSEPYNGELPQNHGGLGLGTVGIDVRELLSDEEYRAIEAFTLQQVRGTVQADILKEDQAQNTCIFSTDFALKLMGDVQQYYIDHGVRNHYSVSISGYHIAEAGANPITQLALTLANGFTYVEYYLSRGMKIDDFAPNLSFFFSNGLDPEYTVIGRVARRIWAITMRDMYGADERSQKLKYHIQTSGRSLHAQEIDFNDIRTTLQALLAIQDHANSLHTNAYDEAITTPTRESVRRALAIQLIVNKESGWTSTENPLQGSFIVDELTELVEQAVLEEFEALSRRGGVLGAMETMYQRAKIQDESMHYEQLKHSGDHAIIGVNTFLDASAELAEEEFDMELARATPEEKKLCLDRLTAQHHHFNELNQTMSALESLKEVARSGENLFTELMQTVRVASLGQITSALFEVGGCYRRNM
mgnify:CR=1 FL=1